MGSAPRLMRFVVGLGGQAAEKAIKALMIRQHFKYPYLHEIWLAYCRCLKKQEKSSRRWSARLRNSPHTP